MFLTTCERWFEVRSRYRAILGKISQICTVSVQKRDIELSRRLLGVECSYLNCKQFHAHSFSKACLETVWGVNWSIIFSAQPFRKKSRKHFFPEKNIQKSDFFIEKKIHQKSIFSMFFSMFFYFLKNAYLRIEPDPCSSETLRNRYFCEFSILENA